MQCAYPIGSRIQILPPDVPLFILKDEAQRIRGPWSKKGQHLHLTIPLQSRFAPSKRMKRWGSPKPANEVEVEAGQGSADLMHCTTRYEGSEVDGDKSDAADQLDH